MATSDERKKYLKDRRQRLQKAGLCQVCGKRPATRGTRCDPCATHSLGYMMRKKKCVPTLKTFWRAQGEWSQATFGPDTLRGPTGPLKHLVREVLTELLGVDRRHVDAILPYASHTTAPDADPEEYADLLFLVVDAARRRGITYEQFMRVVWTKLEKNVRREWPPFDPNNTTDAVEHVRGGEEQPLIFGGLGFKVDTGTTTG